MSVAGRGSPAVVVTGDLGTERGDDDDGDEDGGRRTAEAASRA